MHENPVAGADPSDQPWSAEPLPRVAVVTVSYGSADALEPFLRSARRATPEGTPIVVVENRADEQRTAAIAATFDATYLRRPDNPGYGAAVNTGIRSLAPDVQWVLISNPDVVVSETAVVTLVRRAASDDRIGAVGPRIWTDGAVYPSARALPSLRNGVGHGLFATVWPDNPWSRRYRLDPELIARGGRVGWLSGACLLVRRSVFDQLGGFDESYFMYFEDVDLGARIAELGFGSVYEPEASVEHTGGHVADPTSSTMLRAHHASAIRYLEQRYDAWYEAPLRLVLRVALRVRARVLTRRRLRTRSRD